MPRADLIGTAPPPALDPLADFLAHVAEVTDDPDVRQWLAAMAQGERASCDGPQPRQPSPMECESASPDS
jgi:hypothetical protein